MLGLQGAALSITVTCLLHGANRTSSVCELKREKWNSHWRGSGWNFFLFKKFSKIGYFKFLIKTWLSLISLQIKCGHAGSVLLWLWVFHLRSLSPLLTWRTRSRLQLLASPGGVCGGEIRVQNSTNLRNSEPPPVRRTLKELSAPAACLCFLPSPHRYEEEINRRTNNENDFVILKKVRDGSA